MRLALKWIKIFCLIFAQLFSYLVTRNDCRVALKRQYSLTLDDVTAFRTYHIQIVTKWDRLRILTVAIIMDAVSDTLFNKQRKKPRMTTEALQRLEQEALVRFQFINISTHMQTMQNNYFLILALIPFLKTVRDASVHLKKSSSSAWMLCRHVTQFI